jgi:hypothetical protein
MPCCTRPLALRRALPGTTGQLVSLLKDSSLLSVIGIEELVQKVKILQQLSEACTELAGAKLRPSFQRFLPPNMQPSDRHQNS